MRTKKVKAAGRFRVGSGKVVRERINEIESKQRKSQICIFCGKKAKRLSKGIWKCEKCGKKFTGGTYFLE
ncbi:50S ribosomal protein L37ae [Candidatus Pacearchaeota archaeon]|nr:50S ribosomal protein L37ae [Candidatus Pacearchaeota archaeon]